MDALAENISRNDDVRPYGICIGGSDEIGVWGYIECFSELLKLELRERVTDVVMAVGSGGTAAGIAIGNYLAGSPVKVHAVGVCDSPAYFCDHLDGMLSSMGLEDVKAREMINIVDAKGRGYARNTEDELRFCLDVSRETGVVLDRVYTGKAAKWMCDEARNEAGLFAGRDANVLFLHTGGLFGVFDRAIEPLFANDEISVWE